MMSMDSHAEASVELGAITRNIAALRAHVAPAAVMAVVKANGYGHGAVPAARAAVRGGADWLGVVHVAEALEIRRAGIDVPLLCLMAIGSDDHAAAIAADVDLAAGSAGMVRRLAAAAEVAGRPARVHLKADTGLSRGGATAADWPAVLAAARQAQDEGSIVVAGVWSHFASADDPGNPSIEAQLAAFKEALAVAESAGITPQVRHIANTAAALDVPQARYDLVRVGGGSYGLATLPGGRAGLAAARDDAAGPAGARETGSRGDRGVVRAPVHDVARDDARPRAARLRGRDTALGDRPAARGRSRPPVADRGHCLHGPTGRRLR